MNLIQLEQKYGFIDKEITTKYIECPDSMYVEIKVKLFIHSKGIRENLLLIPFAELSKTPIEQKIEELLNKCISEFHLNNTAEQISTPNNTQKVKQKQELSEEEKNYWSEKAMHIYGDEIDRLKRNKKELQIKDNAQLETYIKNFSNGKLSKASEIVPRNIKSFNDYLEGLINSGNLKAS